MSPVDQPTHGRTLAEQILGHAAGQDVRAGDLVIVPVDRCMTHDSLTPEIIDALHNNLGVEHVYDPERVAVIMDHVAPAASVATANAQARTRKWVREQGIRNFFEVGAGVCHQVLIEERLVLPGQVAIGSDSHATMYGAIGAFGTGMGTGDLALALASGRTWLRVPESIKVSISGRFRPYVSPKDISLYLCGLLGLDGATYQAVEFHGVDWLSLEGREVLSGMSTEIGAKAGLVVPDGVVAETYDVPGWLYADPQAQYRREIVVDLNKLGSQVAIPPEVDHIASAGDLRDVKVDQVFVGTCTNGRLEDLHALANILRGHKVAPHVRLLVIPASQRILQQAVADGTLSVLLAAGATLGTPGCGPCIGRHMGVIGAGEVCLSTANRNFRGRMGDPDASVYLASPEVAGATALRGYISDPSEL
ncbi:MAG: 3-isopropylmalate dehydratase large subunit [Chloroflexi bacterium]|nr:3-isopropylmalate dehydratase large subunit [Chloroflexota bacterium]